MDRDVSRFLLLGKDVLAHEQLAGLPDPVLAERRLHAVDDGPEQPNADIRDLPLAAIAEPGVYDAVSAHEGHAAVDHRQLAMIALVEHADVLDAPAMELLEAAPGVLELALDHLSHFFRASGIQQDAHGHARARASHESGGQSL